MQRLWHRLLHAAVAPAYYGRIRVVTLAPLGAGGREHAPAAGPVLYVGLHRNGAVDGFVYKHAFPRATFMLAARLLRSPLGRLFFAGIPVERARDADGERTAGALRAARAANARALDACALHLRAGGALFVFPEGTSDLGPRHLPFHAGAARIAARALADGVPLAIVPVAVFYQTPASFRGDVTVVVGQPVSVTLQEHCGVRIPEGLPDASADPSAIFRNPHSAMPFAEPPGRVASEVELHHRITRSLESLGVNVETAAELARVEGMARLATDGPGEAYWRALEALQHASVPRHVDAAWSRLRLAVFEGRCATDRGVPAFSRHSAPWSVLWLLVQAPVVALAALTNLPALAAAWLAGRRLADGPNTVALWHILVGAPALALWASTVVAALVLARLPMLALAYVGLGASGAYLWPELRTRWAMLRNAPRRALHADARAVARWVRRTTIARARAERGRAGAVERGDGTTTAREAAHA